MTRRKPGIFSREFSIGLVKRCLIVLFCLSMAACEDVREETPSSAWAEWKTRSDTLRAQDLDFLRQELEATSKAPLPDVDDVRKLLKLHRDRGSGETGLDLKAPDTFYASDEARRLADIVMSFQTPSGGWSKGMSMAHAPRRAGYAFGPGRIGYQPTFDNDATTTQLHFLARVASATHGPRYIESFTRGLNLILAAQMPNGGWPQNYPLDGGYHDLLTYNDDTTAELLTLLRQVSNAEPEYRFVPEILRERARSAVEKGVEGLVASQMHIDGKPTIWGAQQDPMTYKLAPARAFEPASLATSESANLLLFLMGEPQPSAQLQQAIHGAMEWFRSTQINGMHWDRSLGLQPQPGADPMWARFYEEGTNTPLFGDRDGMVYRDVMKLSEERRLGYGWYRTNPGKLEKKYKKWLLTLE